MAVAQVISKGLQVFEQAPKHVQKQVEEGDEQGLKYLEGRAVKKQEIAQLTESGKVKPQLDALAKDTEQARALNIPGHSADVEELNRMKAEDLQQSLKLGKPGEDPYTTKQLGDRFKAYAPADLDQNTYTEVGYRLPEGMLTPEAQRTGDHWGAGTTAHVRRDVKDGRLRVFELQSDMQNRLTKQNMANGAGVIDPEDALPYMRSAFPDLSGPDQMDVIDALYQIETGRAKPENFPIYQEVIESVLKNVKPGERLKLSEFNIKWEDDVINRQFVDAANQGLNEVDFLITPRPNDALHRSDAVQKNYETRIAKKVERLAKKLKGPNGEKAIVEKVGAEGQDQYLRVSLPRTEGIDIDQVLEKAVLDDDLTEAGFDFVRQLGEVVKTKDPALYKKVLTEGDNDFSPLGLIEVLDKQPNLRQVLNSYVPPELTKKYGKVFGVASVGAAFSVPAFAMEETPESREARLVKATSRAVENGYGPVEIRQFLQEHDVPEERQTRAMIQAYKPRIQKALEHGYSAEEIQAGLRSQGVLTMRDHSLNLDELLAESGPMETDATTMAQEGLETRLDENLQPQAASSINLVQRESPIARLDTEAEMPRIDLENDDPEEMIRKLGAISYRYEQHGKELAGSWFGANQWGEEAREMRETTQALTSQMLQARGIQVTNIDEFGTVSYIDPKTGEETEYDPAWYSAMWLEFTHDRPLELVGAIAGARAGYMGGLAIGGPKGGVVGGIIGGGMGGGLGRGADVLNAARQVQLQIGAAELQAAIGDAATADVVMSLSVGALWQVGAAGLKGIKNGYDRLIMGNRHGAYQALKDTTNLNDAQITDLLTKWERMTGQEALSEKAKQTGVLSYAEQGKAIQVLGKTLPELTPSVRGAVDMSKTGGAGIAKEISDRASNLAKAADSMTNDNVATLMRTELDTYVSSTKQFFGDTKQLGIEAAQATDFRFDFREILPVEKMLEKAKHRIRDYHVRLDFVNDLAHLRRIGGAEAAKALQAQAQEYATRYGMKNVQPKMTPQALEMANPYRSFEDLLDLRQTINALSSKPAYKAYINQAEMAKAVRAVDRQIVKASKEMEHGDLWLKQWTRAKTEYTKMKDLEANVLYKALNNPKLTPEKAVKAVADSLSYEGPETFMQVMSHMTPKARRNVEGAVYRHYLQKHTMEFGEGLRATNFPALAKELDGLTFTQPDVRDLKRVTAEFAEVFKNDAALANIVWDSPAGKFKSNIATSVMGKIKMQAASYLFKYWQAFVPTRGSDRLALTMQMRSVLDNPLNAKAVTELKKTMGKDPQLDTLLHQLQIEFAKAGHPERYGKIPLYRVAAPGKANTPSDTSLGRGVLLYADKAKAHSIAKSTGSKVTEMPMVPKRFAQPGDVEVLLGRPPTAADFKDPEVMQMLIEKGLDGLAVGDKVVLFKQ